MSLKFPSDEIEGLLERVTRRCIEGATAIAGLRRLTGGASQETWAFEAVTPTGKIALILRRAPRGERQHARSAGPEVEAELIRLAGAAGVPEPPLRCVLEPSDGLGRGFIMDFVEGETLGRRITQDSTFAEARKSLAWRCGQVLALIHAIPPGKLPPLRVIAAGGWIEEIHRTYKQDGRPRPVISLALEWLRANAPQEPVEPVLVHGDFRTGNLIVGPDGLRAVLDWEVAHLGDPAEDLGWICVGSWRFGAIDKPVGGFGNRRELMAGYRAGGGCDMTEARVRFWEVLGSARWCVYCASMTQIFRSGVDPTPDRAMIARRASEGEIDLMHLLLERT